MKNNATIKTIVEYLVAVLCLTFILLVFYQLNQVNFKIPLSGFNNDKLASVLFLKVYGSGSVSNLLLGHASNLSFPARFNLYDFPTTDLLNYSIAKFFTIFNNDPFVVSNCFLLFTFYSSLISSLFVLRYYRVSYPFALMSSILFSVTHFHFARFDYGHYMLSSYFSIPLWIMVAIDIMQSRIYNYKHKMNIFKILNCLVLILILGATGVYYAFFGCMLLSVALMSHIGKTTFKCAFVKYIKIVFLVVLLLVIQLLPTFIFQHFHGPNQIAAARSPSESITFGLRIFDLLINPYSHLFTKVVMSGSSPLPYIGIIGVIGFSILIVQLFVEKISDCLSLLNPLSKLNVASVLFSTIGGFGTIFAATISPQIRAYDRISIFIVFISLFAFVVLLQYLLQKLKVNLLCHWIIAISITLLAIYFEKEPFTFATSEESISIYNNDKQFAQKIIEQNSGNGYVFQLPFVAFPEAIVENIKGYENLALSLYSDRLFWSYGAMNGRPLSNSNDKISHLPASLLVNKLILDGYNGILINTHGYQDGGVKEKYQISDVLNESPMISEDNHYIYFNLSNYIARTKLNASN